MYHQFYEFGTLKNMDEYESSINQRDYPLPGHHQKEMLIPSTQAPGNQLQQIKTRSIKTCPNHIQISFQTNILYQHVEAMKIQLQKYIESWDNSFKNIPKQKLRQTILNNNEPWISKNVFQIIDSSKCCLSIEKKSMLKKDLQHQQKLKDFLNQVTILFREDVASEIVCLANQIWEGYLKIRDLRFDQDEFKEWIQKWTEAELPIVQKRLFKNLNFKKGKIQRDIEDKNIDENMTEFLTFLSQTIALIIEEYFDNPYYQSAEKEDNFKRSSPCSDFQLDDFSQDESNFFVLKRNKLN